MKYFTKMYQIISHEYDEPFENFMPELKLFCIKNTAIYDGTMKLNDFIKWYRNNANN